MRAPRRISPAARARRSLLVDLIAAILLAALALSLTSGLGVIAFFGIPLLLVLLLWAGLERLLAPVRLRRRRVARAAAARRPV